MSGASRTERQMALWAKFEAAVRELNKLNAWLMESDAELRLLREGCATPVTVRYLQRMAESGTSISQVLAEDRDSRIDELELALEDRNEMLAHAASRVGDALWDARHLEETELRELACEVASGAACGLADDLAAAKSLAGVLGQRLDRLRQADPVPVTAWHLRMAAQRGQTMDEVLAGERTGQIAWLEDTIEHLRRSAARGQGRMNGPGVTVARRDHDAQACNAFSRPPRAVCRKTEGRER